MLHGVAWRQVLYKEVTLLYNLSTDKPTATCILYPPNPIDWGIRFPHLSASTETMFWVFLGATFKIRVF